MSRLSRNQLEGLTRAYLDALDRFDLDAVLSHFSATAIFIVQTDPFTACGSDEIRNMWKAIFGAHQKMRHAVRNVVVDETACKIVTEQEFVGQLTSGDEERRYSVYVFECDAGGRFTRVIVWLDGERRTAG